MGYSDDDELEARKRAEFNRKIARMKREKELALKRRRILLKAVMPAFFVILVLVILVVVLSSHSSKDNKKEKSKDTLVKTKFEKVEIKNNGVVEEEEETEEVDPDDINPSRLNKNTDGKYEYSEAAKVDYLSGENMQSSNAILVDIVNKTIIGQVDYKARINPASMTKVLTILVAAEHVESIKDKVKISIEATDFAYKNDCSSVGFAVDEEVTIEDLFYGTILSSGGDAASQLAMYVAGSQDEFVEMMNEKCKELGISKTTHFTNTVGIYNENHYSTCYDMAIIMNAALDNEFCKSVMSAKKYTTSESVEHPNGIEISNWFLRRIEDKDAGGNVLCAKTGYVVQSGNCAVSYMEKDNGNKYICVTADAHSAWRCIYDHVDIYKNHTN